MQYGILAIIIGAILAVSAIVFVKDKGTRKTLGWIGAILLIPSIIYLATPTTLPFLGFLGNEINLGGGTLTVGDTQPVVQPKTSLCVQTDPVTVTLSAQDKYTSTASGGTHRYRLDGGVAKTVSDAGTFTASPGQTLEVLYGNGTSGSYFGIKKTFKIPCRATYEPGTDEGQSIQTVQNGTLTMNVYNEEGNQITEGVENETIGANDVANLKIELKGPSQKGFPYGGILLLELNGSDFDEEKSELTFSGLSVNKISKTPNFHTITNTANKLSVWEVSAFEGTATITGSLYLDSDTNNNPGDANDPVITFYPYDYYVNEDTGGSFDGPTVEDEDNAQTFLHTTSFTIHID